MRSVVIERTNVTLSTTFWRIGQQLGNLPAALAALLENFHGLAMICCEPFNARPLISNGAGLPSYFSSAGFGSNMSMVLGPPPM